MVGLLLRPPRGFYIQIHYGYLLTSWVLSFLGAKLDVKMIKFVLLKCEILVVELCKGFIWKLIEKYTPDGCTMFTKK